MNKLGKYNECLSLVNEVLEKIIQEWDLYCKIDFLLQKAEALEQLADFDEELKVINKIEVLISEVEIQPEQIDIPIPLEKSIVKKLEKAISDVF